MMVLWLAILFWLVAWGVNVWIAGRVKAGPLRLVPPVLFGLAVLVLWEGAVEESDTPFRIYSPALAPVDFVTDQIRLTLDTSVVTGWNEIDAVQLFGRP
jgi:NitT/TauT family transport system permease protein